MSKKPMKKKSITEVPQVEVEKTPQDLEDEIIKMQDGMWEKYCNAVDTLSDRIGVMADQFATATGVEQAMKALEAMGGEKRVPVAVNIAIDVSDTLRSLKSKTAALNEFANGESWKDKCKKLREFCDALYDHNVSATVNELKDIGDMTPYVATQLMLLDVCRFVGPACEDIADFIEAALDEIDKVIDAKAELEEQFE